VLARLLLDWEPSSVCLIESQRGSIGYGAQSTTAVPSTHGGPPEAPAPLPRRPSSFLSRLGRASVRRTPLAVPASWWRARQLALLLRAKGCTRLLVCTGGFEDIPEAFWAGRWANVPVVAYYFDWYGMQWPTRIRRALALWIESRIIRRFEEVIVPNHALCDALAGRYGVQPVVIHNPCQEGALSVRPEPRWPMDKDEIRIVYTGAIYHAHFDAFRTLALTLAGSAPAGARLHIYTSQPSTVLKDRGIEGAFVFHAHLPCDAILEVQRHADILYLPLAFETPIDEVLLTSAPGKMGDYLVTGRPILVHAPADSYVSRYFRKHGCGVVVDSNSPYDLAGALERIARDASLRKAVGEKARERARIDFDPALARANFRRVVDRPEVP
jgi:glycosyltransferase involved in cell wall biosynthesis